MSASLCRLRKQGADPIGSTPEGLDKLVKREPKRWTEVIRDARIKLE